MACSKNNAIGYKNKLPWNIPLEMEHFTSNVTNNIMIMGYKTYLSTPNILLNKCYNIVFSKEHILQKSSNIIQVKTLEELHQIRFPENKKMFMIGGGEIASLFLRNNMIEEFILSIINKKLYRR